MAKRVQKNEDVEPEEVEVEEQETVEEEVEADEVEADEVEADEVDTEDEAEYPALPVYEQPIAEAGEGFDFMAVVHEDLKASGYVANKGETKALIAYLHQMIFYDALETGEHKIPDMGTLYSEVKPSAVRKATFDMPSGTKKGETYETAAKHKFGFKQSPAGTRALAEISELAGWAPEDFLEDEEEEA